MSAVPLAAVVALLEVEPSPAALARALELDAEALRCEAEGRRAISGRTGAEDAWRERAARARGQALKALREGET